MANPALTAELTRLRAEQSQARRDEVYGGFSCAELAEYGFRSDRIHELEKEILAAESQVAAARQRLEWNKHSETDMPQSEGRQPYRSREEDSANDNHGGSKETGAEKTHKSE